MSYENAPATEMVATYCACCGRPLVDAVSVETGVGPECRKRHGFDDSQGPADWGKAFAAIVDLPEPIKESIALACAELHQRRAANVLVHFIAVHQDDRLAVAATEAVSHLGFTKLAERIAKRVGCVRIEQEGDELLVRAPYSDHFNEVVRRVPGQRWDREAKARRVPVESKRALWVAMQKAFSGGQCEGRCSYRRGSVNRVEEAGRAVAQCACGRRYTASEFEQLPNRKRWPDFGLEIASCTACNVDTTIGRALEPDHA